MIIIIVMIIIIIIKIKIKKYIENSTFSFDFRGVFTTCSNIYDGSFRAKKIDGKSR